MMTPGCLLRSRIAHRLALAVLLFTQACDRRPTAPEDLLVQEIILVGDDGTHTFSHTDHWHGAPVVRAGEASGFTMYFTGFRHSADDHDMPPIEQWFTLAEHPEYHVHVVIENPSIASWSDNRVQGTLHGLTDGASRMTFVVRRGATTIYEAPPLNFVVQPPATTP